MNHDTKNIDSFDKNLFLVFSGTFLVNLFNLLYQLFLAHSFNPQDFAAFNSLLSIFIILSSPLMTLQTAVVKFGSEFNATNQINKLSLILSGLLKRTLWLALATFCLFYFTSLQIITRLKIPSLASGYILAILLASTWITPILLGVIQSQELFAWLTSLIVITSVLKLILSIVFIRMGFNVSGALSALLVSGLIGIAISYLPLKNILAIKVEKEEVRFREIFMYIFPVAVSYFCFMALVNMDMILVKYFFISKDSGLYSLAQMIGKIFLYLPAAVSIVMLPRTSSLCAKNLCTLPTLKKSLLYVSVLCIIAVLFYNFFPYFTLKVLTGKVFIESVVLGRLFSVSMSFFALLFVLITYFLSVKDFRFINYLIFFTLLQFLAIVFFHRKLIHVQATLCINSALLFCAHLYLAHKKITT